MNPEGETEVMVWRLTYVLVSAVIKLVWVVNTGQILSMCNDDCLYLLDVKREVEIVQVIRSVTNSPLVQTLIFLIDLTKSV